MPDNNVFLRWARLKQASKNRDAEADQTDVVQAAEPSTASGESEPPFDIASLPSIESIAAHTDIAAFLNTGVPVELTRAALRRAWATDPVIRDFIGIAENQWDFNDPDAIPGFGPLDPTDNIAGLIAEVSRGLTHLQHEPADTLPPGDPVPEGHITSKRHAVEPTIQAVRSPRDDAMKTTENREAGEQSVDLAASASSSQRTRRHGSALPRY